MRLTISVKIVILSTIVLVMTLAASSVSMELLFSREYTRALESRALAIGQALESQLDRLLNLDIELKNLSGFENQCRAVVDQYEGISYAMVVDPGGRILFHSAANRNGQHLATPVERRDSRENAIPWVRREGAFYEAVIPIFNGVVHYQGTVHVGFPVKSIIAKLRQLRLSSTTIGIVMAAGSALVLLLLLQSMVTRPLKDLMVVMQAIRAKRADFRSSKILGRHDEIGKLHAVFDELMQKLDQSRSEIEAHASHLEDVVAQRTKELRATNHELREEIQEREAAERRYRELFEDAPVMYVITDNHPGEPVITNCNELFRTTLGYGREQIVGRKLSDFYTHASKETMREGGRETGLEGRFKSEERQLKTRDKRQIDTLLQAIPQTDAAGRRLGTRAMFLDITDRKQAEAEKEELLAKLQRAEKLESIGVLAGGVAHDLNNILSGIVSYPELLLMQLPDESPLREPIQTIRTAGQKAAEIVQDLLTLARRGVSTRQVVNINDIISDYLRSPDYIKLLTYHQGIAVDVDLSPNLLNMTGSPIHIRKTIMNLVANAAEAQPEGGRIHIATRNHSFDLPQIGYEKMREGDFVAIEIADHGCGIVKEDLDRIFEPFYTKKVMGRSGSGLGMAVVWGTVQDHHGYIDVESKPNEGTRFFLYFPVTREPNAQVKVTVPISEYMGRGQSILIVDDVKEQRQIATSILEMLNYKPVAVDSGEKAITYLQIHTVDLVLLDMIMEPGMDGLEAYQKMLEIRPGQKAIIASGFAETERVRQVQSLGAHQYIKKPYTLEAIGAAIKGELNNG